MPDTMPARESIEKLLSEPLDDALVSILTDGPSKGAPYIEGFLVIQQANRIFGHGNWSMSVKNVQMVDVPFGTYKTRGGDPVVAWYATVRVEAFGKTAEDVGMGITAMGGAGGHEMALKGAVTDAMKRAFRHFGDQFGNALYDKEDRPTARDVHQAREAAAAATTSPSTGQPMTDEQRKALHEQQRANILTAELPETVLKKAPDQDAAFSSLRGCLLWCAAMVHYHVTQAPVSERDIYDIIAIKDGLNVDGPADIQEIGSDRVRQIIIEHCIKDAPAEAEAPANPF